MSGEIKATESSLNQSDPYAIHHSDNPSTVLVTPILTGDNYGSWNRVVTMALRAKSKFSFVDGSSPKPNDVSAAANLGRCNDLVSSWILNSVSPKIRPSILYAETANQIWVDLKDRFSRSNAPKIYLLKHSISSLKQDGMTVSLYFTQLKSLWDELCSIVSMPPCIYGNAKWIVDQQNQDRAMETCYLVFPHRCACILFIFFFLILAGLIPCTCVL